MAKKSYYTNAATENKTKLPEHIAMLHRAADTADADYEAHAKEIRTLADSLDQSQGQPRTRNVSGTARHGRMKGQGK